MHEADIGDTTIISQSGAKSKTGTSVKNLNDKRMITIKWFYRILKILGIKGIFCNVFTATLKENMGTNVTLQWKTPK